MSSRGLLVLAYLCVIPLAESALKNVWLASATGPVFWYVRYGSTAPWKLLVIFSLSLAEAPPLSATSFHDSLKCGGELTNDA